MACSDDSPFCMAGRQPILDRCRAGNNHSFRYRNRGMGILSMLFVV